MYKLFSVFSPHKNQVYPACLLPVLMMTLLVPKPQISINNNNNKPHFFDSVSNNHRNLRQTIFWFCEANHMYIVGRKWILGSTIFWHGNNTVPGTIVNVKSYGWIDIPNLWIPCKKHPYVGVTLYLTLAWPGWRPRFLWSTWFRSIWCKVGEISNRKLVKTTILNATYTT